MVEPTLPAFAKAVSSAFPELEGRVIPVIDSKITKDNVPTLPLAMLALIIEKGNPNARSNSVPKLSEDFILEFWLPPEKYKIDLSTQTEFWSFYNYEHPRDKVMRLIAEWLSPRGSRLSYVSLETDATEYASILTFRFMHEFEWCDDEEPDEGLMFTITSCLVAPPTVVCEPECEECQPAEICP